VHPLNTNLEIGTGRRVLVIGAGVVGLTSALCLRRSGFDVTVVADRFAPRVTSVVAGALWEWPPAVCGAHHDETTAWRYKSWCEASYLIFAALAGDRTTGVFLRTVNFYFTGRVEADARQRCKMEELKGKVRQFRHDSSLIAENRINPEIGLRDAYSHLAPMIDTNVYMSWLFNEVRRAGCRICESRISGPLREQADALSRYFNVHAIVNCTGLGARELADDAVYPVRGALIRVRNDGRRAPRITEAHCVSRTGASHVPDFIFIVPRGEDMLLLGGLAEPDKWDLNVNLENNEAIQKMYRRCVDFLPILKGAMIDAAEPVRVGLRPFRRQGVRLEIEPATRIVHNFGHGGSGVTLSWGCGLEVADRVTRLLVERKNQSPQQALPVAGPRHVCPVSPEPNQLSVGT
jgi:D-amino-acid oxidase